MHFYIVYFIFSDIDIQSKSFFQFCFSKANDETRQQTREYEETKKQIEEDADREILDIKNKYERRLRDEKEANMRLKGETGIMKKKVFTFYFLDCDHRFQYVEL